MMRMSTLPPVLEDAVLLAADWRWREGPRLSAWLAWAFGPRETFVTSKGDVATLAWLMGRAFLIHIEEPRR